MNIQEQVTSFDLAQQLKALGVTQDSLFWWVQIGGAWKVKIAETDFAIQQLNWLSKGNIYAAFTVVELGELLPWIIYSGNNTYFLETSKNGPKCADKEFNALYCDGEESTIGLVSEDTEADVRAKMLVYLLENELISL